MGVLKVKKDGTWQDVATSAVVDDKGLPVGLAGATEATRYVGATLSGAPISGTFAVGDFIISQDASIWICTVAGAPGTWEQVSGGGGAGVFYQSSAPTASAAGDLWIDSDDDTPAEPGRGLPIGLTGATGSTRYVGGTATVAPATGTFLVGDYVISQNGKIFICTVAGSPGTWVEIGAAGAAGGDLSGNYPNPTVAKVNGVAISGTPSSGQVPTATGATTATWQAPTGGVGPISTVVTGGEAGTFPTSGQGANGDFAIVQNLGDGDETAWLVGPKASGVWPSYGYLLQKGRNSKIRLAGDYTSGQGATVSLPVHYAMALGVNPPDTTTNGFVSVAALNTDGVGVYPTGTSIIFSASIYRDGGGFTAGVASIHAVSRCRVRALPAAGVYAGCGTAGSSSSGYWAFTDSNGKLSIVAGVYNSPPAVGTPMVQGANGDVAVGDWIVFKREGPLLQAWSLNGTTMAVKKSLVALQSGPGDQGGAQYFATGAAAYCFYGTGATTARLSDGWAMG